jgi:uncharacterized protein
MKHIVRVITHWGLLLHIYVSMAGFALTLLFALTGLTLNHQDFGAGNPRLSTSTIEFPPEMMANPNRNAIAAYLASKLQIATPLKDYHEDDEQIQMTYAAPGHRTVVTIDREKRTGEVEFETRGLLGRLDDLHKGFDSGRAWYWVIDVAAILLGISALTGMVTLISLRARRVSGFVFGGMGLVTLLAIYFFCVPR